MIHRTSQKITDFLCSRGVIEKEEADIYTYGYEAVFSGLLDLLLVIAAGLLLHCLDHALVFLAMFVSVRMYSGGYHAETYLKCKIMMVLILLGVLGLSMIELPLTAVCLMVMLLNLTVFFQAPIENPNKPLDALEKKKYHRFSMILSVFWGIAAIVLFFLKTDISVTIAGTAFCITMLMVVEIYGRENAYEE